MNIAIDFNCDLGEDESAEGIAREQAILPHVSSINVACGFHAGSVHGMRRTMKAAASLGVAIGAHPSLDDREGFGRRELDVTPEQAYTLIAYQVGAAAAIARSAGARLNHVKPHGALYNMAARDPALAAAIAQAVRDVDGGLVLYALAGSKLVRAGEALGLRCANEVFADRSYQPDGSLTPRSRPGALVDDPHAALIRLVGMLREACVTSTDGSAVALQADTVCIHGDSPRAPEFALQLRRGLEDIGIPVRAILRKD